MSVAVDLTPCCADVDRMEAPDVRPLDDEHDAPEDLAREARRRASGLLDGVTDTHTHLFPDGFYAALWRWFDAHAWSIAFRGNAEATLAQLADSGATRVAALVYAHKPGVASLLNGFVSDLARAHTNVLPVGTVLPGEPQARAIVHDAVSRHGVRGIKLHCHVQRMAIDDPRVVDVLAQCAAMGIPAVVHCGRAPRSTAYGVDTHAICSADRCERVLQQLPSLRLLVPHVGADECDAYLALLDRYEHLYLDTSMSCAEYFAERPSWPAIEAHADRILYGSDFPLTPFDVHRQVRLLARRITSDTALAQLLRGTAQRLWG